MNAVIFRPLPYREAERLVQIWGRNDQHKASKAISDWIKGEFVPLGTRKHKMFLAMNEAEPLLREPVASPQAPSLKPSGPLTRSANR
jgi:hypothetical protein